MRAGPESGPAGVRSGRQLSDDAGRSADGRCRRRGRRLPGQRLDHPPPAHARGWELDGQRLKAAPPVVAFDEKGRFIRAGARRPRPAEYQWPNRGGLQSSYDGVRLVLEGAADQRRRTSRQRRARHRRRPQGQRLDHRQRRRRRQILKFTRDGKFLLQIGHGGAQARTATTRRHVSRAASLAVYAEDQRSVRRRRLRQPPRHRLRRRHRRVQASLGRVRQQA